MCIAIYQPSGTEISEDKLWNSFKNNGDGCGLAYINVDHKGVRKIKIKKSMTFDKFMKNYKRAKKNAPDSPFLIHFRIKTHGEISTFNCHPFLIDNDHVFIHNGIIHSVPVDKIKSDTQIFNELCLKKLPSGWMNNEAIRLLIEKYIGGSKIVVMDLLGTATIFNEDLGYWVDDVWYSNKSYEDRTVIYKPYTAPKQFPRLDNDISDDYMYHGSGYQSKWLPPKKEYTDEELDWKTYDDEEEGYLTEVDETACDDCGVFYPVSELYFFMEEHYNFPSSVCAKCLEEDKYKSYIKHKEIGIKCYLDYINSDMEDEFSDSYNCISEWENPWGIVVHTEEEKEAQWLY